MRRYSLVLRCGLMLALSLASGSVVADQASSGVTVVDEKTAGDVTLKVRGMLEVHLQANHTTGYGWVQVPLKSRCYRNRGRLTIRRILRMERRAWAVWRFGSTRR
jgi:hypothetical protein